MQKTFIKFTIFCAIFVLHHAHVIAQTAEFRDIIINEVMVDPSPVVGLPEKEFIEIFNRSNKTIDLSGWTIKDASNTRGTLPFSSLDPGEYAIICKNADALEFSSFGKIIIASTLPALNNDADSVVLRNAEGEIIDAIYYRDSWYQDAVKRNGGYTLELINPSLSCSDATNWIGSNHASGGTPGQANSVLNNVPDITPPSIIAHALTSPSIITITFSEAIDIITAENPNLYEITPEIQVNLIEFNSDRNIAILNLAQPIEKGIAYEVKIFGISDCEGNSMEETTFELFLGEPAGYHDIIITEIMADPSPRVQLPEQEYIEIFNNSEKAIDLNGILLTAGTRTVGLPEAQLLPKEYAVLVPIASVSEFTNIPKVIGVTGFPSLTNSGSDLTLTNAEGDLIFHIQYSDNWYATSSKKEGGWSLEMIDLEQVCAGRINWKESVDPKGGTPGRINSVNGIVTSNTALQPVAIELLSENVVQVIFSEKFSKELFSRQQIEISPALEISRVEAISPTYDKIEIVFANNIPAGTQYNITLSEFYNCAGEMMEKSTLKLGLPVEVEPGDIVINELMYEPHTGNEDFVELLNISDKIISLADLIIAREDAMGSKITYTRMLEYKRLIFPGEYLVLSPKGESIRGQYTTPGPGVFVDIKDFPSYVNDGGVVALYRNDDVLIDKMTYDAKMHFKILDITKGVSLEKINPNVSSEERSNWNSAAISIGGATPGYQNSQFLIALPKGELSVSPEVFSPDQDGIDDVLGINYTLEKTGFVGSASVYTIEGIPVRKLFTQKTLAQEGFFTWDGLDDQEKKARVGIYIVVLEIFDLDGNKDILRAKCVVAARHQ